MKVFGQTLQFFFHEREVHQVVGFLFHFHLTHSLAVTPRKSKEVDVLFILNSFYNMHFVRSVKEVDLKLKKKLVTVQI